MPSLIYPLMTALHAVTENVTDGVVEVETFRCLSGCHIQRNTVNIVSFGVCKSSFFSFRSLISLMSGAITPVSIEHCDCISPAVALLHHGSFPTTPKKAPTWAFDLKLLEFSSLLSLYGSPNISALSNATTAFLLWHGVQNVPVSVSSNPF